MLIVDMCIVKYNFCNFSPYQWFSTVISRHTAFLKNTNFWCKRRYYHTALAWASIRVPCRVPSQIGCFSLNCAPVDRIQLICVLSRIQGSMAWASIRVPCRVPSQIGCFCLNCAPVDRIQLIFVLSRIQKSCCLLAFVF